MILRTRYIHSIKRAVKRSPITTLIGPRQCGKTTIAHIFSKSKISFYLDLESPSDLTRLQNPELFLGSLKGLVIIDEIQQMPELFPVLRVLADRKQKPARFLILGSASPFLIRQASESLAGRVEFIEMSGFDVEEVGIKKIERLWMRGGFPRSFLARTDNDSFIWRENFIKTFLQRDIPQLGISIPAVSLKKFWTMVSHYHGQIWNASELGRSLGLSDKTVKHYMDILTDTFMIRQLQPWYENIGKRQVKSPKIYLRDSGLFHSLMSIPDKKTLMGHPKVGASWEGFMIEQILNIIGQQDVYFWATHSGAEIDMVVMSKGKRYGIEFKWAEMPNITKSIRMAMETLSLHKVWIIYPGKHTYEVDKDITVLSPNNLSFLQL